MPTLTLARPLAVLAAVLACGTLQAQTPPEAPQNMDLMGAQLAAFGGTMQAAAETCGGYDKAELDSARAQQQQQMLAMGMSAEAFNAAFQEGIAAWQGMSREEQEKACAELERESQMAEEALKRQGN